MISTRAHNNHIIQCLRSTVAARIEPHASPAEREAKVFACVLEELPLFHTHGDLLAGDYGWRKEDEALLRERFPAAMQPESAIPAIATPEERLSADFHCFGNYSPAHTCIDYDKVLQRGILGMLAEIESAGDSLYRESMKTALGSLVTLAERYADLLTSLQEPTLAACCRRVPEHPAESFHEAMQSIWFTHMAIPISEYSDASISLGRLDQYAYPAYLKSLADGATEAELEQQFAALVQKLNRYGDAACNINLGGIDADGKDLCNPLTRLIVRVVKKLKLPSPILATRIHPSVPQDLFDMLIDPELFAIGQPTFYGEHPCRAALQERGVQEPALSSWAASSCMALVIEGAEVSNMWGGVVNLLLPLELTVNQGKPFHKELPVDLRTPAVRTFRGFEDLYGAFLEYLGEITAFCTTACASHTQAAARQRPNPYLSAFLDHCIERGKDRLSGGVSHHTAVVEGFGLVNAADALYAIKVLIFDRQDSCLDAWVDAAKRNFQGDDDLRRKICSIPKYGNGDDLADAMAARLADDFQRLVCVHSTPDHMYAPSFHTLNAHVRAGQKYGASLDGRLSGKPLAKNVGTSPGVATAGLTALIRSAATIDQRCFFGGQALDISIVPSDVVTVQGKRKLQAVIQTYFELGGLQLQVNGLDAETLAQAISDPDSHADLIVRIGGYSTYFNHLSTEVKQEMVERFSLMDYELTLTARVQRLRTRLDEDFSQMSGGHQLVCPQEQATYAQLVWEGYSANAGKPELLRRAEFLALFAEKFPVPTREDELIVGSKRFASPPWNAMLTETQLEECGTHRNHGHIIVDYGRVVALGLPELRRQVATMPEGDLRTAFSLSLEALAVFVGRHGCEALAERAPETFHEALQMTWFIQIFLRAEGNASAVSFGRLDQFLWPFLKQDLESVRCTLDEAYEQLCCFLMKCCEGGESQNLTLGGNDDENLLSLLVLRAMCDLKVWQPSISVRISSATSDAFWDEALRLCETGVGMPSFFNDAVVTKSLQKLDIPLERARDWGIVGCYEASPQGDTYPLTVGGGLVLPQILWDYLQASPRNGSFENFYAGFKDYFAQTYTTTLLPGFDQCWQSLRRDCASPFESLCVTGCIDAQLAAEEGGARFNLFGVNILGIGTSIDSLLSIKQQVYGEKAFTLEQMTHQLAENFPDQKLLLRCRSLPGKFGTDTTDSNAMAQDLSSFIAKAVLESRLPHGVRPYPGFFRFGADIAPQMGATADGRLANERLSYGCGPGVLLDNASVTSVLNAAACINHVDCACGNPLTLSFSRNEIVGNDGRGLVRQVVESYFSKGGSHLHFNMVDADHLKQAKANPDAYRDLTVRISGYSARFVSLGESWQDAIIERTAKGM